MEKIIPKIRESEEIKFKMREDKIADWISRLIRLKNKKEQVILEIDDYLTLHINYQGDEE
jgi:hypothetical protein